MSSSAQAERADVYRPCSIKRDRRTKADINTVKEAILEIVGEDPPMTVRQVFYRLVVGGFVEKSELEYKNTVIRLLTDMRLSGEIAFDDIVDESRRRRITQTFDNIAAAVAHTARFYRRSALQEAADNLEIWCEKDALAGILWDVTSDYDRSAPRVPGHAITHAPIWHRASNLGGGRCGQENVPVPIRRPRS
jgi:hypothetical protein